MAQKREKVPGINEVQGGITVQGLKKVQGYESSLGINMYSLR